MTTPSASPERPFAELWLASIESTLRDMPDDELQRLIAKVRGVNFNQPDPADRQRNIMASIAAKSAQRPVVDNNGYPIVQPPPPTPKVQTDPNYLQKLKGYQTP